MDGTVLRDKSRTTGSYGQYTPDNVEDLVFGAIPKVNISEDPDVTFNTSAEKDKDPLDLKAAESGSNDEAPEDDNFEAGPHLWRSLVIDLSKILSQHAQEVGHRLNYLKNYLICYLTAYQWRGVGWNYKHFFARIAVIVDVQGLLHAENPLGIVDNGLTCQPTLSVKPSFDGTIEKLVLMEVNQGIEFVPQYSCCTQQRGYE
ncbi:hypothetical protein FB446DRAFT_709885 [Lentinula raphanica]|nr:hypothetical protein FB446DRAFT_709885 [Lentinula raphanica]